jgi:quercetin dioxygenase-like cupin family protein
MDKNPSTATVKTPPSNFTGDVWMNPVFGGDGTSKLTCGLVRFTPGARTNWHSHVMCHYAILDASGDGEATTWLEPVTDEQYLAAHRTAGV